MEAKATAPKAHLKTDNGHPRLATLVIACAATIPFALLFLHACSIDR